MCGRPLGMRLDADGYLIVLDTYLGMYKINVATGVQTIVTFCAFKLINYVFTTIIVVICSNLSYWSLNVGNNISDK